MKRIISFLMAFLLIVSVFPLVGTAAEMEIVYFPDGSYMTVELERNNTRASGSVTGNKRYTYYDENDSAQWQAVLTGSFTYTGSSATCTSSSISTTIYDSYWYVVSKSASKSGSKATGSVVMGYNLDGVTISRVPANLTLSCDANGNLS